MENEEHRFVENFKDVDWQDIGKKDIQEVSSLFGEELIKEASKKYVPIGTVVGINGNKSKYMVIGFNSVQNDGTIKDYVVCLYPIGVDAINGVFSLNHEDISRIYHIGYFDMKGRKLQNDMNQKGFGL